jgi:hypothetical protein
MHADLSFAKGHSKLDAMFKKPVSPMVTMTMAMRSMMRMEMSRHAEWKAR